MNCRTFANEKNLTLNNYVQHFSNELLTFNLPPTKKRKNRIFALNLRMSHRKLGVGYERAGLDTNERKQCHQLNQSEKMNKQCVVKAILNDSKVVSRSVN